MNNVIFALLILWSPIHAAFATQGEPVVLSGNESGGGGQVVQVHGDWVPRDLVTRTACRWYPGQDIQRTLTYFPRLIRGVARTHWYLADVLNRELSKLRVCLTRSNLVHIYPDLSGSVLEVPVEGIQTGIRFPRLIYVDDKIASRMRPSPKAYFYAHELMHSFVPFDTFGRDEKIWSFMQTLADNERRPMTRELFAVQMQMASLTVVDRTDVLDPVRSSVLNALDESAPVEARQQGAAVVAKNSAALAALVTADRARVREIYSSLNQRLAVAVTNRDVYAAGRALNLGADINTLSGNYAGVAPDPYYGPTLQTPLIAAVKQNDPMMIAFLLMQPGVDVNLTERVEGRPGGTYGTALLQAVRHQNVAVVRQLLADSRVDPNAGEDAQLFSSNMDCKQFNFPLIRAAGLGNLAIVEELLAHPRINVNLERGGSPAFRPTGCQETALACAVKNGQIAVIHALLRVPETNVNASNGHHCQGLSPIHLAVSQHPAVMQALLNSPRVRIDQRNRDGFTARTLLESLLTAAFVDTGFRTSAEQILRMLRQAE